MHRGRRSPSDPSRVVLSDILPFEVPPIFSNRGFYDFLVKNRVSISDGHASWARGNLAVDRLMKLVLGESENAPVDLKAPHRNTVKRKHVYTIPFQFEIGRKTGSVRTLSICHPLENIQMVEFYAKYWPLITHYTSVSPYSMRHPVSVSRYSFTEDRLHARLREAWGLDIETGRSEPDTFRSYFRYDRYSNIFKFYESRELQKLEKNFPNMLRLDVARCFDSIYTHSIAWAVHGKDNSKQHLFSKKRESFAEAFDRLMQKLNYNETNGIVVGPEFSRIFAEVILQAVDRAVSRALSERGCTQGEQYEVLRYVDDYFLFTDGEASERVITGAIQAELLKYNLHLNDSKRVGTRTPDVTPISIAKLRISRLLHTVIAFSGPDSETEALSPLDMHVNGRTFITEYKTILKETGVEPSDVTNYVLAVVERRIVGLLTHFADSDRLEEEYSRITRGVSHILEFAFFVYAGSPNVNPTVKLSRIANHVIAFALTQLDQPDQRTVLLDSIYHECRVHLRRRGPDGRARIESLYLLSVLAQLGRAYLLPLRDLLAYFSITDVSSILRFERELDHFSIMTLFHYMQLRARYRHLRGALELHALQRIEGLAVTSAERLMLVLDLIACPYVSDTSKAHALRALGVKTHAHRAEIIALNDRWFINWQNFDLGAELDAKRNQEVY